MRFAYADPPYIGEAHRYPEKTEVDHAELIDRLASGFPDGWALSCHTPSLRVLLPLCPDGTRVCAWVKPWACFRTGMNPQYAWEPVLLHGGRRIRRPRQSVRDWVSCIPRGSGRRGVLGAKPDGFSFWLFDALGMEPGDELVDLFPGSGAVSRAWLQWSRSLLPKMDGGRRKKEVAAHV